MQIDYKGKTVIVTGAAGAIGTSICEEFARNGANVAVCARNKEKGEALVAKIVAEGGSAKWFPLDVTTPETIEAIAEDIYNTWGGIHVLINNAGVNVGPDDRGPVHEFKPDKWDWIMNVDLDGTYNTSRYIVPYMIKSGGGNIMNISSVVGVVPFRNQCAFTAAKAAVINFTKAMAIELANQNIRVNVIAPGSIMFEGTAKLFYADPEKAEKMLVNIPQHRAGAPIDIANGCLYMCHDVDAGYVTGALLVIDGGWTSGFARDF